MELIDTADDKDAEIDGYTKSLNKIMEVEKKATKKKQDVVKAKVEVVVAKVEKKKKEEFDAQYAYTPKEGFDWDNVSGTVTDII